MVAVLDDGAFGMAVGDKIMATIRMDRDHAARLAAEHVGDMGEP